MAQTQTVTTLELRMACDIITRYMRDTEIGSGQFVYLRETRREFAERIIMRESRDAVA